MHGLTLTYEPCRYPAALFDTPFAPRKAANLVLDEPFYVLDGGAPHHLNSWKSCSASVDAYCYCCS